MSSETWQPPDEPDPVPPRRGLLTAVFVGVIAIGLATAWLLNNGSETATLGEVAPPFTATMFDGSKFDLESHLADDGRPVVLNLWASWCEPCRQEIPDLSAWATANEGVLVVGLAVEDVEADARALGSELSPVYALGIGDDAFRASYPSLGLPSTFVIDGEGRVTDVINGILTEERLDASIEAISG